MSKAERLSYYPPLLSVSYPRKYTIEEYLEIEAQSENKLDYVNGYIVPTDMGGTFTHSIIGTNVLIALRNATKGKPCTALNNDLRIKTKTSFRFPDALVVCNDPKFYNKKQTTLLNPAVLIEIVSPESNKRDYVDKRAEYFSIKSLQHYIIIEQDRPFVTVFSNNANGLHTFENYDANNPIIVLSDVDITIALEDIYDNVDFN